jgi:DNA-binding NtrC family response regulator
MIGRRKASGWKGVTMQERLPRQRGKKETIRLRKQRILIVDDDLNDLLYYSAILQHEGYEVRSVASYKEGADCIDRQTFDLVIVSQGTAAFEGRSVLGLALRRDSSIPVFVLSRSSDVDCYLEAMQMGAFDYREKPLAASELAAMVARQLQPSKAQAA